MTTGGWEVCDVLIFFVFFLFVCLFCWFFLSLLFVFIRVQLLYNIVLVSDVQQSAPAICMHISPPSWTSVQPPSYPLKSSQSTELSPLNYIGGSHQLPISQLVVYMCVHTCQSYSPNLFHPPLLPHVHTSILYIRISIPALQIGSSVPFSWIPLKTELPYDPAIPLLGIYTPRQL